MTARPKLAIGPAAACGVVVAAILLATPVGFVETLIASSGLSEALPAAAPPLGLKARLLLAAFGAIMAMGMACAGWDQRRPQRHEQKYGRREGVRGVKNMGFALSKLSWLARSRGISASRGRPALRRADAHPDAPARAPIYASRDFGGLDIFPRVGSGRQAEGATVAAEQQSVVFPLPRLSAVPLSSGGAIEAEFEEVALTNLVKVEPQPRADAAPSAPPSIAELTDRLEQGLARRARAPRSGGAPVLADLPMEQPVPVRDHVEDEADQALRLALSTLRAMVEQTRQTEGRTSPVLDGQRR